MTAKHTPAPWDARWMMHNGECSQYLVTHKNLYEECDANAKLIAAAPDLLEALQFIENYTKDYPVESCGDEFKAWVEKARAAIAKATGKTQ